MWVGARAPPASMLFMESTLHEELLHDTLYVVVLMRCLLMMYVAQLYEDQIGVEQSVKFFELMKKQRTQKQTQ